MRLIQYRVLYIILNLEVKMHLGKRQNLRNWVIVSFFAKLKLQLISWLRDYLILLLNITLTYLALLDRNQASCLKSCHHSIHLLLCLFSSSWSSSMLSPVTTLSLYSPEVSPSKCSVSFLLPPRCVQTLIVNKLGWSFFQFFISFSYSFSGT